MIITYWNGRTHVAHGVRLYQWRNGDCSVVDAATGRIITTADTWSEAMQEAALLLSHAAQSGRAVPLGGQVA